MQEPKQFPSLQWKLLYTSQGLRSDNWFWVDEVLHEDLADLEDAYEEWLENIQKVNFIFNLGQIFMISFWEDLVAKSFFV